MDIGLGMDWAGPKFRETIPDPYENATGQAEVAMKFLIWERDFTRLV